MTFNSTSGTRNSKLLPVASGLVAIATSLIPSAAIAQVTIRSTGTVSGTVTLPNINPNFNQGTTRVDTDSQGRYFRNGVLVYSAQDFNPNLVGVDSNGRYYVDFRGIPVVSVDGSLISPVLNGQLELTQRFNNRQPVRFWGVIQDEFVVQGRYTGVATDPTTGLQYQGTFSIRGQGPRYSDRNGGSGPTVFDFQSHYNFQANPQLPPTVTVTSYTFNGMPVQLWINVPAGLSPLPGGGGTPGTGGGTPGTGGGTPGTGGGTPGTGGGTGGVPGGGGTPGTGTPPVFSDAEFQINRVVLESAKEKPQTIEPPSRVLLR